MKAFIKPFEAPQRSVEIKVSANYLSSSKIGMGMVNRPINDFVLKELLFWFDIGLSSEKIFSVTSYCVCFLNIVFNILIRYPSNNTDRLPNSDVRLTMDFWSARLVFKPLNFQCAVIFPILAFAKRFFRNYQHFIGAPSYYLNSWTFGSSSKCGQLKSFL